jgi:hypothetical protein
LRYFSTVRAVTRLERNLPQNQWATIAETSRGKTSYKVENQPNGTYFHRVQGVYRDGGGPPSNVVDIIVRR